MSELIAPHGGYKNLKCFQIARLVYDLTVRFVELYVDRKSRTCDQMVQAARSGVQNIAEGSLASGTSKKTELKLTNVARASLEELKLDYIAANAGLILIEVSSTLLDKLILKMAQDFTDKGGFTEKLYRVRSQKRAENSRRSPADPEKEGGSFE